MPIRVRVTGVAQELARLTAEIERTVESIDRDTGINILQSSPVDTGFFRSNWIRTTGRPSFIVNGTRDPNLFYPIPPFANTWRIANGNIYFGNGVDYAEVLDAGSSPQAPQGITEPVATRIDARFNRVL